MITIANPHCSGGEIPEMGLKFGRRYRHGGRPAVVGEPAAPTRWEVRSQPVSLNDAGALTCWEAWHIVLRYQRFDINLKETVVTEFSKQVCTRVPSNIYYFLHPLWRLTLFFSDDLSLATLLILRVPQAKHKGKVRFQRALRAYILQQDSFCELSHTN